MDIRNLSEPELKALALRKNAQGCATAAALKAQAILYERLPGPAITSCCPGDWIAMGTATPRRENKKDERPDIPGEVPGHAN